MKDFLKNFQTSFLLAALLLFSFNLLAQGSAQGYLYVYPSDPSAYPDSQGTPSNPGLQAVFQQYQVVLYTKSFPGAQSEELENAYEVHCDGNVFDLKTGIESTGLFESIQISGYYELATTCPTECTNPLTVNDPGAQYQFDMTQAGCAWTITQGSPEIIVGVADATFDLTNDDLNDGQIVYVWGANNGTNWHGSRVAGMIVATPNNGVLTAGLAPNCKVAAYSVPTNGNFGNPWPAIWQAYLDGRRIINVSWSGPGGWTEPSPITIVDAIKEIVGSGTLLVVAAGNGDPGNPTPHDAYADIPGVLMVSSVSSDGSVHEWVDYNEYVDLCAPGNGVGNVESGGWGTSYSAPAVCAAAGLILSVNDCLSPTEIENILKASACPMIPHPQVDPNWVGAGYLNMYQAVLMAQGRSGTLSQDETWEDVTYVPSDLIVPSGITLTINGDVKFSEGASLVIQPGGRVNLYGALTNSCMGPWDGVRVEGMATESQYTSGKHGRLYTYDGAVIENAITGVKLVDGGIIYGNGTIFKNNGSGVVYSPYSNFWPFPFPAGQQGQPRGHFGSLSNCAFFWNDDFTKASPVGSGVNMLEVRGINMTGCSFINERTIKNPASNADYGYGVKATDARFTVASLGIGNTFPPSSYDHSAFKGLGYGVYVGTAQSGTNGTITTADDFVNVPYIVQQATFDECIYGIHNRFVSQGTIVGNTFNMGKLPPAGPLSGNTPFTNIQVGVFIENGANGFELQENHFAKIEDNVEHAFGTYSQNLGWFNNDVRRNTYANVEAGNLADENNAINAPNRGLYYLCNTNTTQVYDFYVYPGSDIRFDQGEQITGSTSFRAAGNIFTKVNPPFGDFENNGPQVRYYHDGLPEKPMYHFGLAFSDVDPNTCESDYCLPPCREKEEWQALKSEYNTNIGLYHTAVQDMQMAQALGDATLADQKANLAGGYRLRTDELSNTLSLHLAFDTTTYSVDSVRVWWQKMDSPVSDMVVARDHLAKGQNSAAFAILDAMSTKHAFSESELAELNEYRAVMEIMQGESAVGLAPAKVQQLLGHATNGQGIGAAWAKNILTVHDYHFPPQPKILGSGERSQKEEPKKVQKPDFYLVSPNPAREQVRFVRSDATIGLNTSVIVTDAIGRIVWRTASNGDASNIIWQTGEARPGVYFYTIQDAGGLTQSGRIVLVK